MKTKTIKSTLGILVLIACVFTVNIFASAVGKATITFSESSYDFGKVEQGVELTHIFKFKNTGDGNLIIQSVNAGCGCTGVEQGDKQEYGINEEGEIKISFNTAGREGIQTKTVSVSTNDPDNPAIVLSFTCEIYK